MFFFSVGQSSLQSILKMKEDLLMDLDELGPLLPSNSLDELIEGLGGPKKVSEVSFPFMIMVVVSVNIFCYNISHKALQSVIMFGC